MQPEQQFLLDIVDAADAIARFLDGIDHDTFLKDEVRQSAIIQKIGVIGEAAGEDFAPSAQQLSGCRMEQSSGNAKYTGALLFLGEAGHRLANSHWPHSSVQSSSGSHSGYGV